ncbi:L,D-transpeptidase family protein [Pseudoduganella sp. HUAS MS19]
MCDRRILGAALLTASLIFLTPPACFAQAGLADLRDKGAVASLLDAYRTQHQGAGQRAWKIAALLDRFYRQHDHALAWQGDDLRLARQALQILGGAAAQGLVAEDYTVSVPLPDANAQAEQQQRFDVELSAAMLSFLSDLHAGRTAADFIAFTRTVESDSFDAAELLGTALKQGQLSGAVSAAEPRTAVYQRVKQTLAHYRLLEPQYRVLPPLPPPPAGVKLVPGMPYSGAAGLRQRLILLDDLSENEAPLTDGVYSPGIETGVRRFQLRHGLEQDGIPGNATLSALQVPLAQRILQLELTLERLRWMPPLPRGPLIVVNVPSFRLWALDTRIAASAPQLEMRVIVGTAGRTPTPLLIGELRYLEFNPAWNVPRSIAMQEIMPKLKDDPSYLDKQDMELVGINGQPIAAGMAPLEALRSGTVRVRQRPGTRNVLGAVKFAMPNPLNIYLHATSATQLFAKQRRDLSHGCIRLEQPAALAQFVLRNEGSWDSASVEQAMQPGPTRTVTLRAPVPVVLLYATAVTDRQGRALFFQDIYKLDRKLAQELALPRSVGGKD